MKYLQNNRDILDNPDKSDQWSNRRRYLLKNLLKQFPLHQMHMLHDRLKGPEVFSRLYGMLYGL